MTTKLIISATTTDEELESIGYVDMRNHAAEVRDMAKAVIDEQGDQVVLELHDVNGIDVLYSPAFGYAYVNENTTGVGDSLIIGNGEAASPEEAAAQWGE